ncbi:hypothetical protein NUSPORA_01967 [Nucleospora cyclopteri]
MIFIRPYALFLFKSVFGYVRTQPFHNSNVTETLITSISTIQELKSKATLKNVHLEDDHMVLQGKQHEGSLINFKDTVEINHFSVTFTIDHLQLREMEKSGVFIWFTDKALKEGKFKGGPGKFKGLMAGIEFSHNQTNLVFTYNNNMDFTEYESFALHKDQISPSKLEMVDKLKIKVIHTDKNFKIEVYDGDLLISDTFKVNDPTLLEMDESENHFAMTTYYDDASKDIAIDLTDIKIYKRIEGDDYKNMDLYTSYNSHDVPESQKEVGLAVANLGHFIAYISTAFGNFGENVIQNMVTSIREEIKNIKEKADNMLSELLKNDENEEEKLELEASDKLDQIDRTIKEIYEKLNYFKMHLNATQGKSANSHALLIKFVVGFGVFVTVATLLKLILSKKDPSRKTLKDLE